jgi:hypothetical protein
MSAREVTPEMVERAMRVYQRVHWGQKGNERASHIGAPNPFFGVPTELGELVAITYRTRKGFDRRLVDYEHAFERTRPRLSFNSPHGLLILGGSYRVTTHGIEG